MFRSNISRVAAITVIVMMSAVSCATAPHRFSTDPLGILGNDAPWYAVFPVEANRPVLEAVSSGLEDRESFLKNIGRAEVLYLAGLPQNANGLMENSFSLVATGSFPASMISLAFRKKDGWEKQGSRDEGVWYRRGGTAVAMPRPGLLLISNPETLSLMRDALDNPQNEPVHVISDFRAFVPQSGSGDGTIALYIRDRQFLSSTILEMNELELPIQGILATARRIADNGKYRLILRLYFPDERTSRAMLPLVRLALSGTVTREGNTHILEMQAAPEDIAELLGFVYF